jgi:predicted esterase
MACSDDPSLHLPRLLCLHGGGVNAEVFHLQCRSLRYHLSSKFRFVFADGPFPSEAGPGIAPVYADYGPFRRWARWQANQPHIDTEAGIKELDAALQQCMDEDDQRGATGEWVGLLGFSQGATVSASLMLRQQIRCEKLGLDKADWNFKFAVLLAGRAPLVALDTSLMSSPALLDPKRATSEGFNTFPASLRSENNNDDTNGTNGINGSDPNGNTASSPDYLLKLPTIHVHGLADPGLWWHRILFEQYCQKGTARLIQWGGEHRVPIKRADVEPVAKAMLEVAEQTGVVWPSSTSTEESRLT